MALLADRNIPLDFIGDLTAVIAELCPESQVVKYGAFERTTSTQVLKNNLGDVFHKELCDQLKTPGWFFSIIMDETTDKSTIKQCAYSVIYFSDQREKVTYSFLGMVEMPNGDAQSLTDSLLTFLTDNGIPIDTNLWGFLSDTPNVMVGETHSVFKLLKDRLPAILNVKCSCHLIHNASCKASKKLGNFGKNVLRMINTYFNRSVKRTKEFRRLQELFCVKLHKMLSPGQTRWLTLLPAILRLLEQYEALLAYFEFELVGSTNLVLILMTLSFKM